MLITPMLLNRSITIKKSPKEILDFISDFENWREWSPWLKLEPTAKIKVVGPKSTNQHMYDWTGEVVGSGRMTIAKMDAKSLLIDLQFFTPFKSKSQAEFIVEATGAGESKVTWKMIGSLPIFLFFIKKMMIAFVGNDFERGLKMLKDKLETGTVPSRVDPKGIVDRGAFYYIGIRVACEMKDMNESMHKTFSKLGDVSSTAQPQFMACLYHDFDMVNGRCDYTAALALTQAPASLPQGFIKGEIPIHRAFQVDHWGAYKHLGNGWSCAMSNQRHRKLKQNKSIPMYEIYRSMPGMVPDEKLHTEIFLPVK